MPEYKILKKRRMAKQIIMGMFFIFILIGGWRWPLLGYFIPVCMLLGIGIGLFRGRKWCDWFCPRGSFADTLFKAVSPKREIPKIFKRLPLRIGFLSFLMAMMIIQIILRWPDPYKIGMFFVIMLTATTVLGIILALIFQQRTWCYICPIGSMANWVGRGKHLLRIDSKLCTECKACYKVCPIQVGAYRYKKDGIEVVKDGDCLKCRLCVAGCPKKALSFPIKKEV